MKSFAQVVIDVLKKKSPVEMFSLLRVAAKSCGRQGDPQQIFRFAQTNRYGLGVAEYPSFRLKTATRPEGFPRAGRLAVAYKTLVSTKDYVDLRVIVQKARSAGLLRTISDCPEYWMYEALTNNRTLFAQKGSLKIGLIKSSENIESNSVRRKQTPVSGGVSENIHEVHLESLIVEDLEQVEPGLTLVGRQYEAPPVGRIDLLCKDRRGDLVVIEIKRMRASTESIIDQVTRYIGWVQERLATPGKRVRGIIIVGRPDQKLTYSIRAIPNLSIKSFTLLLEDYIAR